MAISHHGKDIAVKPQWFGSTIFARCAMHEHVYYDDIAIHIVICTLTLYGDQPPGGAVQPPWDGGLETPSMCFHLDCMRAKLRASNHFTTDCV